MTKHDSVIEYFKAKRCYEAGCHEVILSYWRKETIDLVPVNKCCKKQIFIKKKERYTAEDCQKLLNYLCNRDGRYYNDMIIELSDFDMNVIQPEDYYLVLQGTLIIPGKGKEQIIFQNGIKEIYRKLNEDISDVPCFYTNEEKTETMPYYIDIEKEQKELAEYKHYMDTEEERKEEIRKKVDEALKNQQKNETKEGITDKIYNFIDVVANKLDRL